MGEWKEIILEDIALVIDCEHKTAPIVEMSEYYSVRTSNISSGKIDFENCNRVDFETYQKWTKREIPKDGDIVLAREAPVGEVGIIKNGYKVCLGQRTVLIRVIDPEIDSKYLLYFLVNPSNKSEIIEQAGGSVVSHINMKDIRRLKIIVPELMEQITIASILSSLDDKIDLLHRQNATLEKLAETLFRQWFVEEAKEEWENVKVGDFVKTNKATIKKDYPFNEIMYLDTSSLNEGSITDRQFLNLSDAPSRAKRLVKHNDILFSTVRPDQKHYGIVKDPEENLVVSTGFCVISAERISPHFVYLLLTNSEMTEFLHSIAEGSTSTYPSLKPVDIEKVEFQLPPKEKLNDFEVIASNYWDKINSNQTQIRTLTALRDNLLPKLMSGEVRVEI